MKKYVVAIHELDTGYGGAEEGGWWYTTGTPARQHARWTRVFKSRAKAIRYCNRLNREVAPGLREGYSHTSAAYRGGDYGAEMQSGTNPREFPGDRPMYC